MTINTAPLQQFVQQVKAAELSQQREIKMDLKSAKLLVFCMTELNSKLVENYDGVISKIQNTATTINLDGGGFWDK